MSCCGVHGERTPFPYVFTFSVISSGIFAAKGEAWLRICATRLNKGRNNYRYQTHKGDIELDENIENGPYILGFGRRPKDRTKGDLPQIKQLLGARVYILSGEDSRRPMTSLQKSSELHPKTPVFHLLPQTASSRSPVLLLSMPMEAEDRLRTPDGPSRQTRPSLRPLPRARKKPE